MDDDDMDSRLGDQHGPLLATLRHYHAAAQAEADNDEVVSLASLLADHTHHADVCSALRRA